MQSDIGAPLTSFSGKAPPREFVTVMQGYDRQQVDEHIRQIDAEVRRLRTAIGAGWRPARTLLPL